jgi:cyclophilin family peptidyl-prolyl cis-trans isomerase/HEAT repeat protein
MLIILAVAAALSGAGTSPVCVGSRPTGSVQAARLTAHGCEATDSLDVRLYARILRSADQRTLDTALITTALASSSVEIRRAGARTLSQVALRHRAESLPLLRQLAGDPDSSVASAAIFGMGLIHDTASVALLASVFRDAGAASPSAAWALGEIGAPAADSIAALLGGPQPSGSLARAMSRELIIAASKMRPLNFAGVAPYLASRDAELRWAAAYAVSRQRARGGTRSLLDAAAPDAAFRAELARQLTAATVGDSLRSRAIARLRTLVSDPSPYVRINAVRSIGTFGIVARATLLRALRDRDPNVRVAAAQSTAIAFDTVSSLWRAAWNADSTFKIRRSLLESATAAGATLQAAAPWRTSSDWRLRHAVVGAWSGSRDTVRARDVALAMVHDSDARVRGAAYGLLAASDTARRDPTVQRALAGALTDPDSIVRNSMPGGRSRTVDTAATDRPIEWYENAVRRIVMPSLAGRPPRATMRTARGTMVLTLDGVQSPLTVLNYATLAQRHFYDNLHFHRVVPGFVAQDGDPRGDGEGGPGFAIRDELTLLPYARGAVGMALSGPDTGGSQYFLTLTPQPHLTGHYTVFGRVTTGLGTMDSLVEGDAINSVTVQW